MYYSWLPTLKWFCLWHELFVLHVWLWITEVMQKELQFSKIFLKLLFVCSVYSQNKIFFKKISKKPSIETKMKKWLVLNVYNFLTTENIWAATFILTRWHKIILILMVRESLNYDKISSKNKKLMTVMMIFGK